MKKFLVVLLIAIMCFIAMPEKSVMASRYSVVLVEPTDDDFIPVGKDLTVKLKVLDSRNTSYKWGYSFISQSVGYYIPTWSYQAHPNHELSFVIPWKVIEEAIKVYGSCLNLYMFEIDQYGYSTGFYKKIDLVVYYGKGELNQLSYYGEADLIDVILKNQLQGYISNIKPTGGWEKTTNYCCNPPKVTIHYDYRASIILSDCPYKLDIEFETEFIPPAIVRCILKWPIVYFVQ